MRDNSDPETQPPLSHDIRLCFLIPASATDGFRGQIAMFRRSLDRLGGIYERAQVVAVFGDGAGAKLPKRWRPHFERVITINADPVDGNGYPYAAQTVGRWSMVPEDCDFAIMSDADTMILRPFDDLLGVLVETPAVAGSIAHYPFPQHPGESPADKWESLGRSWLGRDLPLSYAHTLLSRDRDNHSEWACPFYVNFGFVIVPRYQVQPITEAFRFLTPLVAPQLSDPTYAGQVALTLALYANDVPRLEADIKYNFPNDPIAERLHGRSMDDLRTVHYLRTTHFDRQQIFANREAFHAFLSLELTGSELLLQRHVERITGARYPF